MIGVDYDLFWTLNPRSLSPFIKAFELKVKYDDRMAWQSGLYIRMAIASSLDKNHKYPSKPSLSNTIIPEDPVEVQGRIKEKMFRQMGIVNNRFET